MNKFFFVPFALVSAFSLLPVAARAQATAAPMGTATVNPAPGTTVAPGTNDNGVNGGVNGANGTMNGYGGNGYGGGGSGWWGLVGLIGLFGLFGARSRRTTTTISGPP